MNNNIRGLLVAAVIWFGLIWLALRLAGVKRHRVKIGCLTFIALSVLLGVAQ